MVRFVVLIWFACFLRACALEAPSIPREMRGVWVASVGNIDWPTKPGAAPAVQQAELRSLLDNFVKLRLNTVILQVRPACDALYESAIEPWSEYLTGRMGVAPVPAWDPLQFAVTEAHARGLELHAWFNPFRARYNEQISPVSPKHISLTHPRWVANYGHYQWLDPGQPEVRQYSLGVIVDVVRRYDVDGIHIDDYFYPYPIDVLGVRVPFPDDTSYRAYRQKGGTLERNDWRRENINLFVRDLNTAIHNEKPWVKFGVSPFGIWRPAFPESVRGLDAYDILFADSKKWLNDGLCDYFTPQLYWNLGAPNQSFSALLKWWRGQNTKNRLLAPGVASSSIGKDRAAQEIVNQVAFCRMGEVTNGVVFWNSSSLRDNKGGVSFRLAKDSFPLPALVPATPWLDSTPPAVPVLTVAPATPRLGLPLQWNTGTELPPYAYILQARFGPFWRWERLAGTATNYTFAPVGALPSAVRLIPLSRTGVEGTAAEWQRTGRKFPDR
ncbi:MAG TPA: family 10 glycosylhydrolase [Candidatus Limnocylindria bacterium]|nr:family 10 glycosylhydrolase [Candidatus Limnocylindria bacterium]